MIQMTKPEKRQRINGTETENIQVTEGVRVKEHLSSLLFSILPQNIMREANIITR